MTGLVLILACQFAQTPRPSDPQMVCGRHCLEVVAGIFDRDLTISDHLGPPRPSGDSLAEMARAAEAVGLRTLPVRTSVANLLRRPGRFAVIAHVDGGSHFVVILDLMADRQAARIFDPRDLGRSRSTRDIDWVTLTARWDGTALLVSPDELVLEERLPWTIGMWLRSISPVLGGMIGLAGLAVIARRFQRTRGSRSRSPG